MTQTASSQGTTAPAGAPSSVLLVDDEEIVRLALSRMLRSLGLAVTDAGDPVKAEQLVQSGEVAIDLLLTDIVMPGMNGRELAERLRTARPDLPVVFMSAYVPETAFPDGRLPVRSRFLHKPFSRDDLRAAVEDILAEAG